MGLDTKSAAEIAKALVSAGAIKPAVGFGAIYLALSAVDVASKLSPSQWLFWVPASIAVTLAISGIWAIGAFLFRPTPSVVPSLVPTPLSAPKQHLPAQTNNNGGL